MVQNKTTEMLIMAAAEKSELEGTIIITTLVDGAMLIPQSPEAIGRSVYEVKLRCTIPAEQVSLLFSHVIGSYLGLRIVPAAEAKEYMLKAGMSEEELQ
jgi:hypothetical protein